MEERRKSSKRKWDMPLVALVVLAAAVAGCANPQMADAFVVDAEFSEGGVLTTVLLYIPNRLIDILDIVHVGYGVGPGFGLDIHLTRYARLDAVAGVDVGIAWLGRHTDPFQYAAYARAGASVAQVPEPPHENMWRFPQWDIGIYAHALLDQAYVAVAPDEILDFFAGLITLDLKHDDFGSHVTPEPPPEEPAET